MDKPTCPYCLLAVRRDDPSTVRDHHRLWHGSCWALHQADGKAGA